MKKGKLDMQIEDPGLNTAMVQGLEWSLPEAWALVCLFDWRDKFPKHRPLVAEEVSNG